MSAKILQFPRVRNSIQITISGDSGYITTSVYHSSRSTTEIWDELRIMPMVNNYSCPNREALINELCANGVTFTRIKPPRRWWQFWRTP